MPSRRRSRSPRRSSTCSSCGAPAYTILPTDAELRRVVAEIAKRTRVDFSQYKLSTIGRRVARRMGIAQVATIEEYESLLRNSPEECNRLANECLIHVTRFFRDETAWRELRKSLDELCRRLEPREEIRAWVAGCSTGEEAYSLAIALEEACERAGRRERFKIFATDADLGAIEAASQAVYDASIAPDLPPGVLMRWFTPVEGGFKIARALRERVVFAQHNLLRDPPFARMDLISCRNLLIYLQSEAQERAFSVFKFALREQGLLFLGSSENLGSSGPDFTCLDLHARLFRIRPGVRANTSHFAMPTSNSVATSARRSELASQNQLSSIQAGLIERALPPTLIVDDSLRLVQSFGEVADFLRMPSGEPTLDVQKLTEGELSAMIVMGVRRALAEDETFQFENVRVAATPTHEERRVRLRVSPLPEAPHQRALAAVQVELSAPQASGLSADEVDAAQLGRVAELENELQFTRESLQATVEELETTNQELQALNEELISSNEELQSTNEELQSMNEELHTVNSEHQLKIEELVIAGDDFTNLMRITSVGAIFLDETLRIRRFTEASREIIALVETDLGRPIHDFNWRVRGRDIVATAADVLRDGRARRFFTEGPAHEGYWICVIPYAPGRLPGRRCRHHVYGPHGAPCLPEGRAPPRSRPLDRDADRDRRRGRKDPHAQRGLRAAARPARQRPRRRPGARVRAGNGDGGTRAASDRRGSGLVRSRDDPVGERGGARDADHASDPRSGRQRAAIERRPHLLRLRGGRRCRDRRDDGL